MPGIDDLDNDIPKEEFKEEKPVKAKSSSNVFYIVLGIVTLACLCGFVYIFFLATPSPKKENIVQVAPNQTQSPKKATDNPIDQAKVPQVQTAPTPTPTPPPLKKPFEDNPMDLEKITQTSKKVVPIKDEDDPISEISSKVKINAAAEKAEKNDFKEDPKKQNKNVREWAIEFYQTRNLIINLKKDTLLVDGKSYKKGDSIDNFFIIDITPNYVRFSDKQKTMFYNLRFIEVVE